MNTLANYKLKEPSGPVHCWLDFSTPHFPSMVPECTLLMVIIATCTIVKEVTCPITYIPALHTRSSVIIDEQWPWFWTVVYGSLPIPSSLY